MSNGRTGLIEAARLLLEIASKEPATEDVTGDEIQALYGVLKNTNTILHGYTITKTVPELRDGARCAAAEMQRGMWFLEDAWLKRYSRQPIENIVPIPLRRVS
jgi:hypothetical protein